MRKISARDIQVFVAGVIAYIGFHFLGGAAYFRDTHTQVGGVVAIFIIGAVSVLLGLSIAAGNMRALRWAQVILWLVLAVNVSGIVAFVLEQVGIPAFGHGHPDIPKKSPITLYNNISYVLTSGILLLLIARSRSKLSRLVRLAERFLDRVDD
jgi:hypothetical protein